MELGLILDLSAFVLQKIFKTRKLTQSERTPLGGGMSL